MRTKEGQIQKLKNFLNSDTTEAKIATVALCICAIASVPIIIGGAFVMGNAVQVFKMFKGSNKYSKNQIRSTFQSLKNQKLIEYVFDRNGQTIVKITKRGEVKIRAFTLDLIEIKKQNEWDGKWRMVMYDLPVRFKKGREALRYYLRDLGFYQFQKSVWVCPYPCEDEIVFIADFFGVGRYVEILTVESMLHEEKLKKYFNL